MKGEKHRLHENRFYKRSLRNPVDPFLSEVGSIHNGQTCVYELIRLLAGVFPRYRLINDLRHIRGHQRNDTVLAIFPCHHPAPRIETITAANRRELNLVLFGSAVRMETDADPVGGERKTGSFHIFPVRVVPARTGSRYKPSVCEKSISLLRQNKNRATGVLR